MRVGLAACDPHGILAYPIATLARAGEGGEADSRAGGASDGEVPADLREIGDTAADLGAIEIIVGLPRSLDGSEGPAAASARGYALQVARVCAPVPVRLVDERLTTVDAHRGLRSSGVSGRGQRRVVDQAAAVLILQSALDAERATGRPPGLAATAGRRKPRRKGS